MTPKRLWFTLIITVLSACSAIPNGGSAPALIINNTPATPNVVVERFLTAWNNADYDAMYATLSSRSRALYNLTEFSEFYLTVSNGVGLEEVGFSVGETHLQGTSAAVGYDVTLQTTVFGVIADGNRTIRLVQEGDQWGVEWSTMDVFEGYTANARFEVQGVGFPRANIYDRNGDPLVIQNGSLSVLYAQQDRMNPVADCQALLANLLYQPLPELRQFMSSYFPETLFYIGEIDTEIEQEYADALRDTCGITRDNGGITVRRTRQYVGNGAMAHITGYIGGIPANQVELYEAQGYSPGALVGRAGIEQVYERQLAGRAPNVLRIVDPGGVVLRELAQTTGTPPQPVYLTIDRDLQIQTARAVAWGFNHAAPSWAESGRSPGGGAVVIDVRTGEILAMASFPTYPPSVFNPDTYDPNAGATLVRLLDENGRRGYLRNRVVQDQFSPGSVFKIISTAAAMEEGLYEPDDIFECGLTWDGSENYGDTFSPRSDWRLTDGLEATGPIRPAYALTSSCDPFFYEVGARMFLERSPSALVDYAMMMGVGEATGITSYIGGTEASGALPVPASVEEAINNTIGQGNTQSTLLQTARMVAAVANGGTLYRPYIVQQVGDPATQNVSPQVVRELDLSPETYAVVKEGMCAVIANDTYGTAYWIFNDNVTNAQYVACGKTGTAQAGYAPHAWFAAYAPADNPQIAVVAMAQNSREGSEVAAPMVRRIMDAYFGQEPVVFPFFWTEPYVPLNVPENGVAGG
jgi:penicillin-binding protein 2